MTSSARLQEEANVARAGLSSALDELRQSVTTTAITNSAMTFAKDGSTAVARAAVDRAMANPLATMVIGAGLLLLLAGDKKAGSAMGSLVDKGTSVAKSAADSMSSAAGSMTDRVTSSAANVADAATDRAGDAQGMLATGQQQAGDMLAKGKEQGQQALHQAQDMFEQGRGKFEQFAQEQPILVAALGVALGAAIGASLPITRTEQDYLGERARKVGSKAGEVAQKAADAVTGTLGGEDVAHKVSEVVDAVSSTVRKPPT
jgi:ElaB/YqjD/DUF883 family membrane-anchored ribosome-binding protein